MRAYHAHVYFPLEQLSRALELRAQARVLPFFSFAGISERPIGPHPLPMLELHFKESQLAATRAWLSDHRGDFSVLIHADTGDDVRDHSEGIEWLGAPVALDFGFFELIRRQPERKIHP